MSAAPQADTYPMAPLIRFTLVGLYLALAAPLPWLAPVPLQLPLWLALGLGLLLVWAITSEQVELDPDAIRVGHPAWCGWLLRRGWQVEEEERVLFAGEWFERWRMIKTLAHP